MRTNLLTRISRAIREWVAEKIFRLLRGDYPVFLLLGVSNAVSRSLGGDVRFAFDVSRRLFVARDHAPHAKDALVSWGSDLSRIVQLNLFGVAERRKRIGASYFLEGIRFESQDVIVDVGANWGDLYGYLAMYCAEIRYIAIEPSPADFRALKANVSSGQLHLVAASNEEGESQFFVNSSDGDSSLLPPSTGSAETIRVQTVRLDDLLKEEQKIRLLKIEAEGFEPEVLVGSAGILSKVEYIALDGGPERGPNEDTTIEFAINFLTNHGFTLINLDVVSGMGRALFKNNLEDSHH